MRGSLLPLLLALGACGTGAAPDQGADNPPLEAPVIGPSAYAVFAAADLDRGWDVLDAMDTELPDAQRGRIQARGLVSGASGEMMVRFSGTCARDGGFVAAVRAVARRRDVSPVRCEATLPIA